MFFHVKNYSRFPYLGFYREGPPPGAYRGGPPPGYPPRRLPPSHMEYGPVPGPMNGGSVIRVAPGYGGGPMVGFGSAPAPGASVFRGAPPGYPPGGYGGGPMVAGGDFHSLSPVHQASIQRQLYGGERIRP